jgi:hypothetical protein
VATLQDAAGLADLVARALDRRDTAT